MLFTQVSGNKKLGPIPVSISPRSTCPDTCKLKNSGCYAEHGPMLIHWRKSDNGLSYNEFLNRVKKLPKNSLWRYAQAGDLPGIGDKLDREALKELVKANKNKKGFTYTHKPLKSKADKEAILNANKEGFTINLSSDSIDHADKLIALNIGPVVTIVKSDVIKNFTTSKGNKVTICPATIKDNVTCSSCGICYNAKRKSIIAFPSHGNRKNLIDKNIES